MIPDKNGFGIILRRFHNADGIFQILAYAHHPVSAQKGHGPAIQRLLDTFVDIVSAVFTVRKASDGSEDLLQKCIRIRLEIPVCKRIGA